MLTPDFARELFTHMEWADARLWGAILASPAATDDRNVRDRLLHIHLTQRVFLQLWTGQPLENYQERTFDATPPLLRWAQPYYQDAMAFVTAVEPAALGTPMPVPWAKYFVPRGTAPGPTTLGETMLQVTAHTAYHRAQVNTRLRDLGAEPPILDYIGWLWEGRPATVWPTLPD